MILVLMIGIAAIMAFCFLLAGIWSCLLYTSRIASNIAGKVGVDEYYSEVLPEDKAGFVGKEKADGRKVCLLYTSYKMWKKVTV